MNTPRKDSLAIKLPQKLEAEILPSKDSSDRFVLGDERDPEQRVRFIDPSTNRVWGFLVVDDTRRGPGVGGIRIAPDLTLKEVARLARAMTLKNSAACLPLGGGKSGLVADPDLLAREPELKSDLIALFAEALFPFDNYVSAPDMGTDEQDILQIYEFNSGRLGTPTHMRGGSGLPADKGGIPIDAWALTAHGLFASAKSLEELDSGFQINSARVLIQGYGNVGAPTAEKLHSAGAIVVGASDIHAGLWNANGLSLDELDQVRGRPGGLSNYTGKVGRWFGPAKLDWLMEAPCDILVPSARPDAITARNADRVQCKLILQGANMPVNKMTEYYLKNRRGILSLSDFIVNVGGVIGCAVELKMTGDAEYRKKVQSHGTRTYVEELITRTISKNVAEIHSRLAAQGDTDRIFREEALKLAEQRLQNPVECWL